MKQLLLLLFLFIQTFSFAQEGFSLDVRLGTNLSEHLDFLSSYSSSLAKYDLAKYRSGAQFGVQAMYKVSKRFSFVSEVGVSTRRNVRYRSLSKFDNAYYFPALDRLVIAQFNMGIDYKLKSWLHVQIMPVGTLLLDRAEKSVNQSSWRTYKSLKDIREIQVGTSFSLLAQFGRWKPFLRVENMKWEIPQAAPVFCLGDCITNINNYGVSYQFGLGYTIFRPKQDATTSEKGRL